MPTGIRFLMPLLTVVIAWSVLPESVAAKSTNRFLVGQTITNPKTLQMSSAEIYRKTVGTPRAKAVFESGGDFAKYFSKRGAPSVAGKAFEARATIKLNQFFVKSGIGDRMLITAVEGFPTDVADLIRISGNDEIKELYQLKAGYEAAIKAVRDSRYAGTTIVTHPDTLKQIGSELRKAILESQAKGKSLAPKWREIDAAIRQNRLTDQIAGVRMPTNAQSESAGRKITAVLFNREVKRQALLRGSQAVAVSEKAATVAAKASGKALARQLIGPAAVIVAGGLDIGFGVHSLYATERRYRLGELDSDIRTGKRIVAASQVGVGTATVVGGTAVALNTAGVSLIAAPEPIATKIAGVTVIVVSVGLAVTDYMLERVQVNRTASRRLLLQQLDERERCRIVLEELQGIIRLL